MRGNIFYDHIIPDGLGGEPTLDNCQVLCKSCHNLKTAKTDVPRIAKAKRIYDRDIGIKKPRKITSWRKFDGTIVRAARAR
jgi:5-methylcytosine-specific restriction endonuclease McrA